MRITFQIDGGEELMKNLETLGLRVQKNVVRRAIRAAQKPMQTAARAAARGLGNGVDTDGVDMSELLAKNIVIAAPKKQRSGSYSLHVQMRRDVPEFLHKSQSNRETYIPAAIEYGHMSGGTYVPAIPFLRRAAEATVNERIRVLTDAMRTGILREAIKGR
jgi:hypothetical protein